MDLFREITFTTTFPLNLSVIFFLHYLAKRFLVFLPKIKHDDTFSSLHANILFRHWITKNLPEAVPPLSLRIN